MFERFSAAARDAVTEAVAQAQALGSSRIRPEHLLLAMLGPDGFLTRAGLSYSEARAVVVAAGGADEKRDADALRAIGIDLDEVKSTVAANFGPDAWSSSAASRTRRLFGRRSHLPFDAAARKCLELALREAIAAHQRVIGVEHLVLGATREPGPLVAAIVETRMSVEDLRAVARASLEDAA